MKNTAFFLIGFFTVIMISVPFAHSSEREKIAYGVYINSYSGTKVAICTGSSQNCVIEYLTGNRFSSVPLDLHIFKKTIPKYLKGKPNPLYKELFTPSQIILR